MTSWYDGTHSIKPPGRKAKIASRRKDHRMRNGIVAILGCFLWLVILSKIEEANKPPGQQAAPAAWPPGCQVYAAPDPGEFNITLMIYGLKQEQAVVDLYRPGQSSPFPILEHYRQLFLQNGAPHIHQTFDRAIESRNLWMSGEWIVKWKLDSWEGEQWLNLTDAAWTIGVRCYISRIR